MIEFWLSRLAFPRCIDFLITVTGALKYFLWNCTPGGAFYLEKVSNKTCLLFDHLFLLKLIPWTMDPFLLVTIQPGIWYFVFRD